MRILFISFKCIMLISGCLNLIAGLIICSNDNWLLGISGVLLGVSCFIILKWFSDDHVCPRCNLGFLRYIKACEPWSDEHWMCGGCNSTYNGNKSGPDLRFR